MALWSKLRQFSDFLNDRSGKIAFFLAKYVETIY